MKSTYISIAVLLLITLTAFGCTKRKEKGGKGGDATLKVTAQHHGNNIEDCTIYLKYDTSVPPSDTTTGYDESVACTLEGGKPVANFTGLKNGKYYVFGYGYDPSVTQNVKGGVPYEITTQTAVSINVPVTEGD